MAYSVEQRTQEIGIRLALGAEPAQVKNMVVVQGMRLALVGVVIGLASAFGLARLHRDAAVRRHGARSAGVRRRAGAADGRRAARGVAAGARASRVDPMVALRRVAARFAGPGRIPGSGVPGSGFGVRGSGVSRFLGFSVSPFCDQVSALHV